ncbi:MAG: phosphopantothenoylcysteine decarboxylase [Planctomycetes bacterium]|nr:phosphopantothenoylcysteine decarboxylase [Planctomycetota bacterium]
MMRSPKPRRRIRFLITAGGTREYIDPVRFISNASSGTMGYELARSALLAGHDVTLITAPTNLCAPKGTGVVKVESARDMLEAVKDKFGGCDCLIMTAAVSDYTPLKPARLKMKKSPGAITLKLKPTRDILKWAGTHKRQNQMVVGFALEDRDIKAGAERKLREKNLDMIVANTPAAIGSEQSGVFVKTAGKKWLRIALAPKRIVARRLISLIQSLIPRSSLVNSDSNQKRLLKLP